MIHWSQLNGNKFLTALHAKMLHADGYALQRSNAISRRNKQMEKPYVIFDRSYVIETLKKQIELLEIDQDEAIDLIGDVFQLIEKERSYQEILDEQALYSER